jgi:arsenite-transporting ATPase
LPSLAVFEAVERLHRELTDVRTLLTDGDTSTVRLVLTPERVVVAEARRTLTALSLHGYRVDGVVVNRVFTDPADPGDAWRSGWAAAQREQLAEIDASFADLEQWRIAYGAAEPLGVTAVSALVRDGYGTSDPMGDGSGSQPLSVVQTSEGFALTLTLPFVSRGDLELARSGDDLVVSVGGSRRVVSLPSALRRCVVAGARLADGKLVVRFVPDPERWPHR